MPDTNGAGDQEKAEEEMNTVKDEAAQKGAQWEQASRQAIRAISGPGLDCGLKAAWTASLRMDQGSYP